MGHQLQQGGLYRIQNAGLCPDSDKKWLSGGGGYQPYNSCSNTMGMAENGTADAMLQYIFSRVSQFLSNVQFFNVNIIRQLIDVQKS